MKQYHLSPTNVRMLSGAFMTFLVGEMTPKKAAIKAAPYFGGTTFLVGEKTPKKAAIKAAPYFGGTKSLEEHRPQPFLGVMNKANGPKPSKSILRNTFQITIVAVSLFLLFTACSAESIATSLSAHISHSWYLTADPADTTYQEIDAMAKKDAGLISTAQCTNFVKAPVVILATGQPVKREGTYGVVDYKSHFWTTTQLIEASKRYIDTWLLNVRHCSRIIFAIGSTNQACPTDYQPCNVDYAELGKAWGEMITTLNTWSREKSQRAVIWGAFDFRPGWDKPETGQQFEETFYSNSPIEIPLIYFGNVNPQEPGQGWTTQDIEKLTTNRRTVVMPQIVTEAELDQWIAFKKQQPELQLSGAVTACAEDDPQLLRVMGEEKECSLENSDKRSPNPIQVFGKLEDFYKKEVALYSITNIQRYEQHPVTPTPYPSVTIQISPTPADDGFPPEDDIIDKTGNGTATPVATETPTTEEAP